MLRKPAAEEKRYYQCGKFLSSVPGVDKEKIGVLGICAGAMYSLLSAAEDPRIKAIVTVASWLHDAVAVNMIYGGEEAVQSKIGSARQAKKKYIKSGVVEYVPAISTTDSNAAMFGPFDYYLDPERGAIPQWCADKFAVMSWEDWLTTDPMPTAGKLTTPILMIHSDGAALPHQTRTYFQNIAGNDKKLHWIETDLPSPMHQFQFYDNEQEVNESVREATKWFKEKL